MRVHLSILLVLLLQSCDKRKEEDTPPTSADPCGTVAGIHHTDNMGVLMYPADSTDWRWSDEWCPDVEALFAGRPPVVLDTTAPDTLLIACFPNPTMNQFITGFYRNDTSYVDVRFVDAQFGLIASFDSITSTQYLFRADSLGITTPRTIRAYYRVVHPDGTAHRGHGDIRIDN